MQKPTLPISIELQNFAVYILVTVYRESESATAAGLKYFLLGSLSLALIKNIPKSLKGIKVSLKINENLRNFKRDHLKNDQNLVILDALFFTLPTV